MSKFGQTLFGGGGFIRWALSPFVLLFAIVMPLVIDEWTPGRLLLIGVMEVMCCCLLAGFWLPPRIGIPAFRILALMVALAYAAYVVDEFFFTDKPLTDTKRRSAASPTKALIGFLVIGVPSLWFALKGRFTLREGASLEQIAAERKAYEDRILRPDWGFYEGHLGRPVPEALRELYADRALVTCCGLEYSKTGGISTFNPLEDDGLLETREELGTDIVAFATSDCGDPIYLRPGALETDTVYIAYHDDPGKVKVFAESVAEMLERLRQENRKLPTKP